MVKKQVDAFLIHGVARDIHPESYYTTLTEGIRDYIDSSKVELEFHPVSYSHLLEDKEKEILKWFDGMGNHKLREFACYYICDVLAYAYPKSEPREGDFIYDVTKLLSNRFDSVNAFSPNSKKIIIGHSLGSIVGYGFTWDRDIDCLITMGNPHDYFSIRYSNFGRNNPNLVHFYNFWHDNDPVATKVAKNPNFGGVNDIRVTSLNPLSLLPIRAHSIYWGSKQVHKKIADIIRKV